MIDTLPVHHLSRVLSILKRGEIVAFPTGTTYGLGVNALDPAALERLNALKGRSAEKAYTLLLPHEGVDTLVTLTKEEQAALQSFANVPLTLLVKPQGTLAALAKDGLVGVRTADHPFTMELVKLLSFPITATSANRSGEPPAYSVDDLLKAFPQATLMAVDGGTLPQRPPSTIVRWTGSEWNVLREGDVKLRDLKKISSAN